jgi:hypothetical protein
MSPSFRLAFLFNIFLSFSSPDEVQASPRSSVGGEEDRKSKKSERSEHSEPQEPEPEVSIYFNDYVPFF